MYWVVKVLNGKIDLEVRFKCKIFFQKIFNYCFFFYYYIAANPYCIIRCGRKYVKSSIEYETLMPVWNNFSAIFYHRDIDKMEPIWIEVNNF